MPIYKIDKKKDGKQGYKVQINYTDKNGVYRQKAKTVYGLPEARLAEQNLTYTAGVENINATRLTINDLFEEYIISKRAEVRQTSLDKSIGNLEKHILPYLGTIKLDKLDTRALQNWKNAISDTTLAIRTKQNLYTELRAMLNYAVKMDYLNSNPLPKVGNFKDVYFDKPADKIHYYTIEQFKKYISVAEKYNATLTEKGYIVFFYIAFFTGMRKGEINALKWSDIDGNIIHVRRSITHKIKGTSAVETPPKNQSSYRDVQIPSNLCLILERHKQHQKEATTDFNDDFRVCGGISCLSDTSIDNKNRLFAKEAGLPHIRIHDFRHSHASFLANNGINIQEVARRLGHSKIEITWNTYSHLYPREEERAVKLLEQF